MEVATHSSVLAWRIPGMGEPGGLPSMGSHRVGHDWSDLAAAAAWCFRYWNVDCVQFPSSSTHLNNNPVMWDWPCFTIAIHIVLHTLFSCTKENLSYFQLFFYLLFTVNKKNDNKISWQLKKWLSANHVFQHFCYSPISLCIKMCSLWFKRCKKEMLLLICHD